MKTIAALLLFCCMLFSSPVEAKPHQFSLSISHPKESSWGACAEKFAALVKERTKGQVLITIHADDTLGNGNELTTLSLLRKGTIDFSLHSTIAYAALDTHFSVLSLPFFFTSVDQVDAVLAGAGGRELKERGRQNGIEILAFGENGMRQFTSNRPVQTLKEMHGLRVRVPRMQLFEHFFSALGAQPTPTALPGLYNALKATAFDAQENTLETIAHFKLQNVQKYLLLWDGTYSASALGMNRKTFESLAPELQTIVKRCAQEACDFQKRLVREHNKALLEQLAAEGMVVTRLTPGAQAEFRQAVKPLYEQYQSLLTKSFIHKFRR